MMSFVDSLKTPAYAVLSKGVSKFDRQMQNINLE